MNARLITRAMTVVGVTTVTLLTLYALTSPRSGSNGTPPLVGNATRIGIPAPNFTLTDQHDQEISLSDLRGKYTILTFMYTHCKDTCPLTLEKIRHILRTFGSEAKRFQIAAVSTDPAGDSPRSAVKFLATHGKSSWLWLLGNYHTLRRVWRKYAIYAPNPAQEQSLGALHTAIMYLIGPNGVELAQLDDTIPAPDLSRDLHILANDHKWGAVGVAPEVGSTAPNFSLSSLNGKSITLSQFRGRPVAINFWASWCTPCSRELPLLESTYRAHRRKIVFIGVDEQEPGSKVSDYTKQLHVTYPIGLDTDGNVAYNYEIEGQPTTFFVNRQGTIRQIQIGALTKSELRKDLRLIS